jgi:hypothetical protein
MQMLSEDDLNLRSMSDEELEAAWDLWFDLAQETNAFDPAYSHGVWWAGRRDHQAGLVCQRECLLPFPRRLVKPLLPAGTTPGPRGTGGSSPEG